MKKKDVLGQFPLSEEEFAALGLTWDDLKAIERDYEKLQPTMDSVGRFVIDQMIGSPAIHSLNYRLKDPAHLVKKIIRKRIENPERIIELGNYRQQITDLIGIRALHLFKEDWQGIHRYICENWDLAETPKAYVRYGDSQRIIDYYKKNDCSVQEHKHGYRSVHYLLQLRPKNEDVLVEVQVRTLFEEAWGEIDHRVRYPHEQDNELLVRLSSILNRLTGDADELASYMRYFTIRDKRRMREHQRQLDDKNRTIERLKEQINSLEIDKQSKQAISRNLDDLAQPDEENEQIDSEFPWLNSFLESNLFQGIQNSLKDYMNSDSFQPLEVDPDELKMLQETQKELMRAIGADPAKLTRLMQQAPNPQFLIEAMKEEEQDPGSQD
ncbi:RelA/SpoT domain-containing protein [Spirochaeta dissipatitropha]